MTDGPFTETKELIGGFALLEVGSKEEAIELAARFLKMMGEGECEIRQLFEAADFAQRQLRHSASEPRERRPSAGREARNGCARGLHRPDRRWSDRSP